MAINYKVKQNDTLPKWRMTLRDSKGAVPLDAALNVKLFMRPAGGGTLKVNGAALTIVDATNGVVEYAWQAADVDTAGFFEAEVQVTFGTGIETFPSDEYVTVHIVPDLGQ